MFAAAVAVSVVFVGVIVVLDTFSAGRSHLAVLTAAADVACNRRLMMLALSVFRCMAWVRHMIDLLAKFLSLVIKMILSEGTIERTRVKAI